MNLIYQIYAVIRCACFGHKHVVLDVTNETTYCPKCGKLLKHYGLNTTKRIERGHKCPYDDF